MRRWKSTPPLAIALALAISTAACDAGDPGGPAATASVSGVVTAATGAATTGAATTGAATTGAAATGAAIGGATVRIGGAASTTGADGRFELRDLPVGSATITVSAPGFEPRSESVSLRAGANTHDVALTFNAIYTHQNVTAYLPPGPAEYEAAVVFLPGLRDPATGNPLDSRGLVRGTVEEACSIWCGSADRLEVRRRALELAGGDVALVGTTTLTDDAASYQTLLDALAQIGAQSLHPELADVPLFFVGHSMGGCTAYGFSRVHGARVAGFLTMKGGCHNTSPVAAAAGVPGHFLIGGLDAPHRRQNITAAFEAGRAGGAPWAVSVDPFDHGPIVDFDLMFGWIDAVLTARLPATPGAPLRAVVEAEGWLGNRSTGAVSTYACYDSDRSKAAWLPSEGAALHWRRMARGTVVVRDC